MAMIDPQQEHHDMVLESTDQDGVDTFYCPICGRRIIMQWAPDYKKIVLEPGDEMAIHSGGKGGLRMGAPEIRPVVEEPLTQDEEEHLAPWIDWMEQVNFDRLWGEAD